MATQNRHSDGGVDLPPAVVEDLLAADSRRRALAVLAERGQPMVVEELARAVVAAREGCPASAVSAAERDEMARELFTEHIPKLTATRTVRYDSMLGAVELRRPALAVAARS